MSLGLTLKHIYQLMTLLLMDYYEFGKECFTDYPPSWLLLQNHGYRLRSWGFSITFRGFTQSCLNLLL